MPQTEGRGASAKHFFESARSCAWRLGAGLSLAAVAEASGASTSEISRIEHGEAPRVSLEALGTLAAVVGLDLSVKTFPSGDPLRDAAQVRLIERFGRLLHPALRWAVEVALPRTGDLRAWDGLVAGTGWRYGVEVETQPRDIQALLRRLALKERDGEVDGVLLVLPDTRQTRLFVRAGSAELAVRFPVRGHQAVRRLAAGQDPQGSALIMFAGSRPAPRANRPTRTEHST